MQFDGVQEIAMQERHRIPDHSGQMVNPIANLIDNFGPTRPDLIRRQRQRQGSAHSARRSFSLNLSHFVRINGRQ